MSDNEYSDDHEDAEEDDGGYSEDDFHSSRAAGKRD
jgi:hypothetical protein